MSSFPYLIGIALIKQGDKRSLPISGRSLKKAIEESNFPEDIAKKIVLELLIRVFQRTDEVNLTREAGSKSLILVEISLETMQKQLPLIKAEWIKRGDTDLLMKEMKNVCNGIWIVNYIKEEGITFNSLLK